MLGSVVSSLQVLCSGFGLLITNDDDHHDPLEDT